MLRQRSLATSPLAAVRLLIAFALLAACSSGGSEASSPPERAALPTPPAVVPAPEPEPTPGPTTPPPPTTPTADEPTPVDIAADPAAPSEPSPLDDARARCTHGWELFRAGSLAEARHELDVGTSALRDLVIDDAIARRALGACEYSHGRALEALGQREQARAAYAISLRHRDEATVRAHWAALAPAGARPPSTAPDSLFRLLATERHRVCRGEPELIEVASRPGRLEPTCGVRLADVFMESAERGAAAVERFSWLDPEAGDTSISSTFPIFLLDGGHWREVGTAFDDPDGVLDRYEIELELRDVDGAPPTELVARVYYTWSYVPSADDGGGSYRGMVVCGGAPSFTCATLPISSEDSEEDDEEGGGWSTITFEGGRIVVVDHEDADDDEGTRREMSLEELLRQ